MGLDNGEEVVGPRKADAVVADAPRRNNFIANFIVVHLLLLDDTALDYMIICPNVDAQDMVQ